MKRHSDDLWQGSGPRAWVPANWDIGVTSPRVDVSEDERELCVTVDLPGVAKNDIQLELVDNTLTIQGERKPSEKERTRKYYVMERAYGSFRRSIPLPVPVDEQNIKASFNEGLLTVILPKLTPSAPATRQIPIESS